MSTPDEERASLLRSHTSPNHSYSTSSNAAGNGNGNASKPPGHWSHWPSQVLHIVRTTLTRDYVNLLLVFVPLGIIAGALKWDASAVFPLNFLAIVPLASLLSFVTEELAATMGQALGGLLNATFGNAVELIVCF